VKPHQIDALAFSVLRDFEQINDAEEAGFARKAGRDIGKADGGDGIHFDFAFFHAVAGADGDVGARPYADAAGDFSGSDTFAEALREDHEASLHGRAGKDGCSHHKIGYSTDLIRGPTARSSSNTLADQWPVYAVSGRREFRAGSLHRGGFGEPFGALFPRNRY